jgi:hypothetical protein
MGLWKYYEPKASRNLIKNPAFMWYLDFPGIGDGNYQGTFPTTGAVKLPSTRVRHGGRALLWPEDQFSNVSSRRVEYVGTQGAFTALKTGTTYTFSCDAYVLSGSSLTTLDMCVCLSTENVTDPGIAVAQSVPFVFDEWFRPAITFTVPSDDLYRIGLRVDDITTTNIYLDGWRLSEGDGITDGDTDYFDGEAMGCYWVGDRYNSESVRTDSPNNGILRDLEDDTGMIVRMQTNTGMPSVNNQFLEFAQVDGSEFQQGVLQQRRFILEQHIMGQGRHVEWHRQRRRVLERMGTRGVVTRLVYVGGDRPVYIDVVYEGGMEIGQHTGYIEHTQHSFIAGDPHWYELRDAGARITPMSSTEETTYIARRDKYGRWERLGELNAAVNAVHYGTVDGRLYMTGEFTEENAAGSITPRTLTRVAVWSDEINNWEQIGSGIATPGTDILQDQRNGNLIVATNTTAQYTWNGSSWTSGVTSSSDPNLYYDRFLNGITRGLALVLTDNRKLFQWNDGFGNDFLRVEYPDLTNDDYLINGNIKALFETSDQRVYVGGEFTVIDGVTVNGLAEFTGTGVIPLGNGVEVADDTGTPSVNAFAEYKKTLLVGGAFNFVQPPPTLGSFTFEADFMSWLQWNGSRQLKMDALFPSNAITNGYNGSAIVKDMAVSKEGEIVVVFDSSGNMNHAGSATINVNALGEQELKIFFSDVPETVVRVEHIQSGAVLTFDGNALSFRDNDTLIDFSKPQELMSTTRRNLSALVERGSQKVNFKLYRGRNDINVFSLLAPAGAAITPSRLHTTMYYQVRHESIDGSTSDE